MLSIRITMNNSSGSSNSSSSSAGPNSSGGGGGGANIGVFSSIPSTMSSTSINSTGAGSGGNAGGSSSGSSAGGNSSSGGSGLGGVTSASSSGSSNIAGISGGSSMIGSGSSAGSTIATVNAISSSSSGNCSTSSISAPLTTKRRAALLNCGNINSNGNVACGTSSAGSSGTGTTAMPITTDLASLFECPVCFEYVLPPILQCQSGHLVCSNCRPKLTGCPTCRGPLGNIRNLAMEKVATTILFPCKYLSSGCSLMLSNLEKLEHEEICEWRPYSCPCPGASCKWQGGLEQVMPHLMVSHKSITTLQGEDIVFLATDINLPGAVDWVMMQSCFGHNFMLVLEKQEKFDGHQQFFAIVQLIGSRKQAENFAYRLELNGHRRRLTWEATPRSIHEGVSTAIMNSDCLVFDTSIAQLFSDNGNLGINVTISMV